MKRFFSVTAIILAASFALGTGISSAYQGGEVKDGGQIVGHVKFVGAPPKLAPIPVDKRSMEFCGKEVPNESLIVGKDGGVKYSVGYLEKIEKGKAVDLKKQTPLDQVKCLMIPHVLTTVKGSELAISSKDNITHNTNIFIDGTQRVNKWQPKPGVIVPAKLSHAGTGEIICDSHPFMKSYVMIFEHPYSAVSDDTGTFTLDNVPPGKYVLKVWHESWKITGQDKDGRPMYDKPVLLSKEIEVKAKGTSTVNFDLK